MLSETVASKGLVRTEKGTFKIERGVLEATDNDEAWSLSTSDYQEWLDRVETRRGCSFDDVANIRVGIKTTADDVFIRDDWESLPSRLQPEAALLRPLITHEETERWIPTCPKRKVLYTHAVENGKRVAVKLRDYPRARAYLESHKERLSSRKYVIEAGRQWHEIWVPHNPIDWTRPKIVSPDISEEPRFCFDSSGAIVNGDCYWMTLRPGFKSDWLLLLLAVANSSFVTRYYDIAFHNKLYAGRRRFMTQYVKKFPLPHIEDPYRPEDHFNRSGTRRQQDARQTPRNGNRPTRVGEFRSSRRNLRVMVFAASRCARSPQTFGRR